MTFATTAVSNTETTAGKVYRRAAPLIISGLMLTDPVVGTSNAVVAPECPGVRPTADRTTAGDRAGIQRDNATATGLAVRALHDRSGLTWEELARLFGVSRRAVHSWAAGGRMNAHHSELLNKLTQVVETINTGDPAHTRGRLMAPSPVGASLYLRLAQAARRPTRRAGPGPADLLAARHDVDAPLGKPLGTEPVDPVRRR